MQQFPQNHKLLQRRKSGAWGTTWPPVWGLFDLFGGKNGHPFLQLGHQFGSYSIFLEVKMGIFYCICFSAWVVNARLRLTLPDPNKVRDLGVGLFLWFLDSLRNSCFSFTISACLSRLSLVKS